MATDSTEDSAQDPVEDAAKKAAATEPYSLRLRDRVLSRKSSKKEGDEFPLLIIFVGIVVAAPIMLVGLPLATLWLTCRVLVGYFNGQHGAFMHCRNTYHTL